MRAGAIDHVAGKLRPSSFIVGHPRRQVVRRSYVVASRDSGLFTRNQNIRASAFLSRLHDCSVAETKLHEKRNSGTENVGKTTTGLENETPWCKAEGKDGKREWIVRYELHVHEWIQFSSSRSIVIAVHFVVVSSILSRSENAVTLRNASDYRTNGLGLVLGVRRSPLVRYSDALLSVMHENAKFSTCDAALLLKVLRSSSSYKILHCKCIRLLLPRYTSLRTGPHQTLRVDDTAPGQLINRLTDWLSSAEAPHCWSCSRSKNGRSYAMHAPTSPSNYRPPTATDAVRCPARAGPGIRSGDTMGTSYDDKSIAPYGDQRVR